MENLKNNDSTSLEVMIRQQKKLNDALRVLAGELHSSAEKLNGEFPNLIHEYDNQEKKAALSHIDKLELNALDYEAIINDIQYSVDNLERSI